MILNTLSSFHGFSFFSGKLGSLKTYYISMQINNNIDNNIDVNIRLSNGTDQTKTVASRASTIVDFLIQSRFQPNDVQVYAVQSGTTNIVYLNEQPELSLQPSLARNTVIINTAGDSGKNLTANLDSSKLNN